MAFNLRGIFQRGKRNFISRPPPCKSENIAVAEKTSAARRRTCKNNFARVALNQSDGNVDFARKILDFRDNDKIRVICVNRAREALTFERGDNFVFDFGITSTL